MELKGYKTQKKDGQFLFFKHGEKQGSISLSDLDRKITLNEKPGKNNNQVKAIIYKYRKQYSGKLRSNHDDKFTTEAKKFKSDLTNFLKQKFGFDFIFFSGKDKELPYGYVVIDHNKREVNKGSDLLKLDLLISGAVNEGKKQFPKYNSHAYTKFINDDNEEEFREVAKSKSEMQLGEILGNFLEEVERGNYQGDGQAKKKRNRKRRGI